MNITQEEKDRSFHEAMMHFETCRVSGCHPVRPCAEGARLLDEAFRLNVMPDLARFAAEIEGRRIG